MRFLKASLSVLLLFVLQQIINGQCLVIGPDMPCLYGKTTYRLNYPPGTGDTIISTIWSMSAEILYDSMWSNKDTITFHWSDAGKSMIIAHIITSNGDTIDCSLKIEVQASEFFNIYSENSKQKCGNFGSEGLIYCEGDSTYFYTDSIPGFSYTWLLNGSKLPGSSYKTGIIHFPVVGTQSLELIATDTVRGCISSNMKSISVIEAPVAILKLLNISTDSIVICRDNPPLRFNNLTNPRNGNNYLWEIIHFNNDSTEYTYSTNQFEDSTFTYTFFHPGQHIVRLTAKNCLGCGSFDEFKVIVTDDRAVSISCPSVVCQDSFKMVTYDTKDTCNTYLWSVIGSRHYSNDSTSNGFWVKWDSFPPGGFGYIKLRTTDCNGSVCDGETIVEVPILPTSGQIIGDKSFCSPFGESTYEVPMWPGASYKWTVTPSNDSLKISMGEHSYKVSIKRNGYVGGYKVKVRVDHPLADCSFEKEDSIHSHFVTLPNDSACFNTSTIFQFDAHGESIDSAFWTFKTITKGVDNSNQVTFDSTFFLKDGNKDILSVRVKFANGDECTVTANPIVQARIKAPTITDLFNQPPLTIVCLDSTYYYKVNPLTNAVIEWNVGNGIKIDSTDKKIGINWNVSGHNNKILQARYRIGQCYSPWATLSISDIDSAKQILKGPAIVCEDSEEFYTVAPHPTNGYFQWIINPPLGMIFDPSATFVRIVWDTIPNDTNVVLTFRDSFCGSFYEVNFPILIKKRQPGIITNSSACAGQYIDFSVNVKANTFVWDLGDTTIITMTNSIKHKYDNKGINQINVKWSGSVMGCVEGFSASKEIEVLPTLVPFIRVYNDSTNQFLGCLLSNDTIRIRFESNQYNNPGIKYKWFIDDIEQTNDTGFALTRTHPTDFDFTNVFVKVILDSMVCTDTAYIRLDTCVNGNPTCNPYDTVRILNVIDSTCYLDKFEGAYLADFNKFIPILINFGSVNQPNFQSVYGAWTFEDLKPDYKFVLAPNDLKQIHDYKAAGYWLVQLYGNARDNIDTTKICLDFDSRIDTIPMVADYIYTFTCDSAGYNLKLKSQTTYLPGFAPTLFNYVVDSVDHFTSNGEAEFHVDTGNVNICLVASRESQYSCSQCTTLTAPKLLVPPVIKITDTVCTQTVLQFDIMDSNFSDDITDYIWEFGDSTQTRIRKPDHRYTFTDTTLTVRLTVRNKWGCSATSTKTIYIVSNNFVGNLTIDTLECPSEKTITAVISGGITPYKYLWNNSDTTSTIHIKKSGAYTVTVSDYHGCKYSVGKTVSIKQAFPNGLIGPLSICSTDDDPIFYFQGDDAEYDYTVSKKQYPGGTETYLLINGTNSHNFSFTNIGDYHVLTLRAYIKGTETICDSIVQQLTIHPSEEPVISDSLYTCKPYTYVIKENNNLNLEWYEVGKFGNYQLDTGNQISIHKGGKYIGVYKNSYGCLSTDTIEIENQINLRPFISGCYNRCDTVIDNGMLFIPMLDDTTTFSWWKYKHLDSNAVLKEGMNSKVDSMLLLKRYAGKMYLVVESMNGCIDSSDLLCLLIDSCFNTINCDSVNVDSSNFTITQVHFNCETRIGDYKVEGQIIISNGLFSLCDSIPLIITSVPWYVEPTIEVDGDTITVIDGVIKLHEDSCSSPLNIDVKLCLDSLICTKNLSYEFDCYEEPCEVCDTLTMTCPHLGLYKHHFDCDDSTGYYQVMGTIVMGGVSGFTLCTPNPFIIDNMEWVNQPTISYSGNTITISGGLIKMKEDSCNGSVNIKVRLCRDGIECIKSLPEADFECYNNTCGIDRVITYIRSNGTRKIDVIGYVDNLVNCGDDHDWVRVRLYDSTCTTLIDQDYVSKTGFNKFRALLDVPDTSAAECYCLKVCLSSGSTQCEQQCEIPFCTGSNQYLSSGGNGNINISAACTAHTTTGNIYSYSTSFDGNAYDIYQDSLTYEAETMSHSCSEGTCSGAFKIDTLATTVDMTLFFHNSDFPIASIGIDTTVTLPNCNSGGGGHHLEGKDTGVNKSKSGEQTLTPIMDSGKGSSLSLIPNPTNSSTTIYYQVPDKEEGWEINILDFAGKSFEKKICCDLKGNFKFDCSDRASGMYFVILKKNGKITASKKLLIIK